MPGERNEEGPRPATTVAEPGPDRRHARVTDRDELNGHLLRLADGRLLLSYGVRVQGRQGVCAKFSADEGRTWGPPLRLARSLNSDCGYPSSAQRTDGRIVTAYYAKRVENHERYHMGVAIWEAPAK